MTYLDQMDQSFAQVHRLVQIDLEAPAEVEKMVLLSAALVGPWCLSEPFA
jgi:hypothetical protein